MPTIQKILEYYLDRDLNYISKKEDAVAVKKITIFEDRPPRYEYTILNKNEEVLNEHNP